MGKLKIALLQISPCGSIEKNLSKGIEYCRKAKETGADIALFPEMWSIGYDIYERSADVWTKEAISADSDFVTSFGKLAKELNVAIGITFLEKFENATRNSLVLFDRFGEKKFVYAKVHTCDFSAEKALTSGEEFFVCELDTISCGVVKVGAMICFDREFPESARILMLKGAEVVLAPNACPMEINRLSALRARAYENMLAIATCNYPDSVSDCNGHSTVFDGVAWLKDEVGTRDMCILEASCDEGIYTAETDIDMLREYRSGEVMGNAFRRPEKYHILTDKTVNEPFIRKENRNFGG